MINRTESEIREQVKKIWSGRKYYDDNASPEQVEVEIKDNWVSLRLSSMYNPPGLSLPMLLELAEFFGTKNIVDERFSYRGCETCDYDSEYGFTLIIQPEKSIGAG